jgi:sensor histidine kinase YesM
MKNKTPLPIPKTYLQNAFWWQIGGWLVLYTLMAYDRRETTFLDWNHLLCFTLNFLLMPALGYFNINVLVPLLLYTHRYYAFFAASLVSVAVAFSLSLGINYLLGVPILINYVSVAILIAVTIFAISLRYNMDNIQRDREYTVAKRLQAEQELAVLRSQLGPHMLFNLLNSMYGLAVEKSNELPELILRMASFLRRTLYELDLEYIELLKAVQNLEDYIHIEKVRYGTSLDLDLSIKGEINGIKIVPFIFVVFIENAFKHLGALNGRKHIVINLETNPEWITFEIANTYQLRVKADDEASGIGLNNVKRRLLALYPNEHILNIYEEKGYYRVFLKLKTR